jgi:hydrogenase nickel incorporation protein HypA/HybF
MHEFSIAQALLGQVEAHVPDGATLRRVRVRAGAMAAIEPQAMQWAWRAATDAGPHDGAELILEIQPHRLHCDRCGRAWDSDELFVACACGHRRPRAVGDAGLTLLSLDIDEHAEALS